MLPRNILYVDLLLLCLEFFFQLLVYLSRIIPKPALINAKEKNLKMGLGLSHWYFKMNQDNTLIIWRNVFKTEIFALNYVSNTVLVVPCETQECLSVILTKYITKGSTGKVQQEKKLPSQRHTSWSSIVICFLILILFFKVMTYMQVYIPNITINNSV